MLFSFALLVAAGLMLGADAAPPDLCTSTITCCFASTNNSLTLLGVSLDGIKYVSKLSNIVTFYQSIQRPYAFTRHAVLSINGLGHGELHASCTSDDVDGAGNVLTRALQTVNWTLADDHLPLSSLSSNLDTCAKEAASIATNNNMWDVHITLVDAKPLCFSKRITAFPSKSPTSTRVPTLYPTRRPSKPPTAKPTRRPQVTSQPTLYPTRRPTSPTPPTTFWPTKSPTSFPTRRPTTLWPTRSPTLFPTRRPTTLWPTKSPSALPTPRPSTMFPTRKPTTSDSYFTAFPSKSPSRKPVELIPSQGSKSPTMAPSRIVVLPSQLSVAYTTHKFYHCALDDERGECYVPSNARCGRSSKAALYKYTPPRTGKYIISTDSRALTQCADTTLQILPLLTCNDDISELNGKSMLEIDLIANEEYTLIVGSYADSCAHGTQIALSVVWSKTQPTTLIPTKVPTSLLMTESPTTMDSGGARAFSIKILFVGSITPEIQVAFDEAAKRWSEVLGESFPGSVNVAAGTYCGYTFPSKFTIADLVIIARVAPIDGPYGVVGSAGPCLTDPLNRPRLGIMTFDSADIDLMLSQSTFTSLVEHEMGHVLGLGTFWGTNLVGKTKLGKPGGFAYLGKYGNIGNVEIGRTGQARVEDEGGEGTVGGHWKETVYETELMTGYISADFMPLSRLTVQALRDLGYTNVDLSSADAFRAPGAKKLRRLTPEEEVRIPLIGCAHKENVMQVQDEPKPGRERDFLKEKVQVEEIQLDLRQRRAAAAAEGGE